MATRSRYCLFTAKEKLRIIEEAENIGNHAAERKYDVSESCTCDWRKNKTEDDHLWEDGDDINDPSASDDDESDDQ